jgi:hypothetical protein
LVISGPDDVAPERDSGEAAKIQIQIQIFELDEGGPG